MRTAKLLRDKHTMIGIQKLCPKFMRPFFILEIIESSNLGINFAYINQFFITDLTTVSFCPATFVNAYFIFEFMIRQP